MRKRLMIISKRCMVAIMSAAFIMSSITVSMAFPVGVYAEEYTFETSNQIHKDPDNHEITFILQGESLKEVIQDYPVLSNYGFIEVNNGTVETNQGEININNGTAGNDYDGTVVNNYAIVHQSGGTITNQYAGTVDGYGGTITNFFGGTINGSGVTVTNNFSTQQITGANQFYSVNFIAPEVEDGTVSYGTGFTAKNDNEYVQVTGTNAQAGVITISPVAGKEITGNEVTEQAGSDDESEATFVYSLTKQDDGSFLLTITPNGNITSIGLETFGLAIRQAIEEHNNVTISQVTVNNSDDSNNNDGDQSEQSGNVTPVIKNTTQRMFDGKNIYLNNGVYEMYYRYQSNMTWDEFNLLCSTDSNIPKNCYFAIEGRLYVLHIPAIDTGSETYKSCLDELKNRPNGLEGPAEIANIFKNLGITCTDMTANQPEAKETRIATTTAVVQPVYSGPPAPYVPIHDGGGID